MIYPKPTGFVDDWDRPIYFTREGERLVDVNLGKGEPDLHHIQETDYGDWAEPSHRYVPPPTVRLVRRRQKENPHAT